MEQDQSRDQSSEKPQEAQVDPDKLAAAKDALRFLDKMVKTMEMFDPKHDNVARAKDAFKEKITEFLEKYDRLILDLDGNRISFEGVTVSMAKDSDVHKEDFSFRLFQDGVTEIRLTKGIENDEIESLLSILLANFEVGPYCHDDTVTLFWEAKPENYLFKVAPEFDDKGDDKTQSAEGTQDYHNIRNTIIERTADPGPDFSKEPDPAEAAKFAKLEAIFRQGRMVLSPEEIGQIEELLERGEPTLVGKYVEVLLRVMTNAKSEEEQERPKGIIKVLVLGLADGPGVEQVVSILERLRGIREASEEGKSMWTAVSTVLSEVSSPELIGRVVRSLAPKKSGDVIDDERLKTVLHLLSLLGQDCIPFVLDDLAVVPNPMYRSNIATLIARMGTNLTDLYRERLVGDSNIVPELLQILSSLNTARAVESMLEVIDHPTAEIRLRVLSNLGDLKNDKVAKALLKRLHDEDEKVRKVTIEKLQTMKPTDVSLPIKELIRDKDFQYRDKDEKRRIFMLLGKLTGDGELPFFKECFEMKNTLKRSAIDETRACGAYMLGVLKDTSSKKALEKGAKARLTSTFFKWACTQAIGMIDGKIDPDKSNPGDKK